MDEDNDNGNTGAEAAHATATSMVNDILASLGVPGSIEIKMTASQAGHPNAAMHFPHVEPVDEEERVRRKGALRPTT
jgi:hypothetical protein